SREGRRRDHLNCARRQKTPPPAPMFCPVIHLAASVARNTATSATSLGSPMLLNGDFPAALSRYRSCIMSVSVGPGEIALTVMPRPASSQDNDYVGGVGYQDVQRPDRLYRFIEQPSDLGRARQIRADG